MPAASPARRSNTAYALGVLAALLIGALIRGYGLGFRDFWFDESCTFQYVSALLAGPDWGHLLRESTNLPYYILLSGWVFVFGESESAYRSLSAVAATAALIPLGWTAHMLGGRRAAIICVILAALHPLHVHYAREARVYALWSLEMSVVLATLVAAVRSSGTGAQSSCGTGFQRPCGTGSQRSCGTGFQPVTARARWWILYAIAMTLALHTHYVTALFILPAAAAVWMPLARPVEAGLRARLSGTGVPDRRWPAPRAALSRWALASAAAVAATLPYAYFAILPAMGTGGRAWIAAEFEPLSAIPRTLWAMLPAGGYPAHLRSLSLASPDTIERVPTWVSVAAMVVPAIVLTAGMLRLVRRFGTRSTGPGTEARSTGGPDAEARSTGGPGTEARPTAGPDAEARCTGESGAEARCTETEHPQHSGTGVPARSDQTAGIHAALAVMTMGPLGLLWLVSVAGRPIYLPGRYDMVVWPVVVVWMALIVSDFSGGSGLRGRFRGRGHARANRIAATVTTVLALCALVPINRSVRLRGESPHHRRAERIAAVTGPGDLVVAFSYDGDHLRYYLHRADFAGEIVSFPSWLDRQVGWLDTRADLDPARAAALDGDADALARRIAATLAAGGDVLLLDDSMNRPERDGPRGSVNAHLLARLRVAGYRTEPIETDRAPPAYRLLQPRPNPAHRAETRP